MIPKTIKGAKLIGIIPKGFEAKFEHVDGKPRVIVLPNSIYDLDASDYLEKDINDKLDKSLEET